MARRRPVIFYEAWKRGLIRLVDREKIRFALGFTHNPLLLSRRWPLLRSIHVVRAMVSPSYARALAGWLRYRLELYDGIQG
jgi:hypothetical protein